MRYQYQPPGGSRVFCIVPFSVAWKDLSRSIFWGHVTNVWISKAVAAVEQNNTQQRKKKKKKNFSDFLCSLKSCSGAAASCKHPRRTSNEIRMEAFWILFIPFHISPALIFSHVGSSAAGTAIGTRRWLWQRMEKCETHVGQERQRWCRRWRRDGGCKDERKES